jgi:hypothetical protein
VRTGVRSNKNLAYIKFKALNPPIIRPPGLDGFFDIGVGKVLVYRSLRQGGKFGVGSKAQGDELAFAELRDT